MEKYGGSFKNLKIELPYDPTIPLLDINTEETIIKTDTCIPMFIAALFTIARTWKQPRFPPKNKWVKNWYIHNGILLSDKKECI